MIKNNDKKRCLCIDTSTKAASVAIGEFSNIEDIRILYSSLLNDGCTHSQKLMPMIDDAMGKCSINTKNIDLFAVVYGPGSFTGLRIGISTMKAFADSLDKPIVGVNTLETLASAINGYSGLIVPMLDARRSNVYTSIYDKSINEECILKDSFMNISDVIELIKPYQKKAMFLGCGVDNNKETILKLMGDDAQFAQPALHYQRADIAINLAIRDFMQGKSIKGYELLPNYINETSAKAKFK